MVNTITDDRGVINNTDIYHVLINSVAQAL